MIYSNFALSSLPHALLLVAAAGVGCHVAFNRFEPRNPINHFILLLLLPAVLSMLLIPYLSSFIAATLLSVVVYLGALCASVVTYRLSPFHPLARYPGPVICKVSKLWLAWISSYGRQHIYYKSLHDKYGPVVRIGPNELSFIEASCINPLLGTKGVPKGEMWEGRSPDPLDASLISRRDPVEHSRRRKAWNRAFSTTAVKGYEPALAKRVQQFISTLRTRSQPIDLNRLLHHFTFDFMADMAFGGGSEMMRDGDTQGLYDIIERSQFQAIWMGHIPWVGQYYRRIPSFGAALKKFRLFARETALARQVAGSKSKDLFYYLADDGGFQEAKPPMKEVVTDGGLAIVAGSDTSATVLLFIIYSLVKSPNAYAKLQQEIDAYFPAGSDPFDFNRMLDMPYLNAVINEGLRGLPPVLSGSQRSVPRGSGGRVLGPYYLPDGCSAFMHFYSLMRNPRYFSPSPDVFLPERWIKDSDVQKAPGFVLDARAFIPFHFGPGQCPGKNIAYAELRVVLVALFQTLDMRFAPGFDWEYWEDTILDFFVTMKGPLMLEVTPRKR